MNTIDDLIGPNGEIEVNENGVCLREFYACSKLRVTRTFFLHKEIHKQTYMVQTWAKIYGLIRRKLKIGFNINALNQ